MVAGVYAASVAKLQREHERLENLPGESLRPTKQTTFYVTDISLIMTSDATVCISCNDSSCIRPGVQRPQKGPCPESRSAWSRGGAATAQDSSQVS